MAVPRLNCLFVYLGRRGLSRFALELIRAAQRVPEMGSTLVVSRHSEVCGLADVRGLPIEPFDVFEGALSPRIVTGIGRFRSALLDLAQARKAQVVINLMPHVWTPLVAPALKRSGLSYVTVVHDAVAHPGDVTGWLNTWLLRDARCADTVITLSRAVAERLIGAGRVRSERIVPLFHPDLNFGGALVNRQLHSDRPLRILFFGRILPYKGLPLLLDAVEMLRAEGVSCELGVYGSGSLTPHRDRLERLGAKVDNRWVPDDVVPRVLAQYDIMACSHIEASQSGVAAAAFASAMPVVALPVGGLTEQVITEKTGVLSSRVSARALADSITRLARDPGLYERISKHLTDTTFERSMERFVTELLDEVVKDIGSLSSAAYPSALPARAELGMS